VLVSLRPRSIFAAMFGASALLAATPAPDVQKGIASFYGPESQGKTTAMGEVFDARDLTAAHPSYPGGTVVKVTNLENSRSVWVRVNDRGPARWVRRRKGVIIDLSREAARELGFTRQGHCFVRIEVEKEAGEGNDSRAHKRTAG
jgi:rare lipoprotein A